MLTAWIIASCVRCGFCRWRLRHRAEKFVQRSPTGCLCLIVCDIVTLTMKWSTHDLGYFTTEKERGGYFQAIVVLVYLFAVYLTTVLVTQNIYYNIQQDATMSSQYFILLQYHSTCFGRSLHPSSGVQETVVTATGIGHIFR
jgi:hypothetical protein